MASLDELRQHIKQAKRDVEDAQRRKLSVREDIAQAEQRQLLRRELEKIKGDCSWENYLVTEGEARRQAIDEDRAGEHATAQGPHYAPPTSRVRGGRVSPHDGKINVTTSISKGEYVWTLQGMSWLESALAENEEYMVFSEDFYVGRTLFDLTYAPARAPVDTDQLRLGSLAIRHRQPFGIIFRYRVFIKREDGDWVQWGPEGHECHPDWEELGKAFGPDVEEDPEHAWGAEPERPFGIFGLTHKALVQSEWMQDDTLSVKVQIEVMESSNVETEALTPAVIVPAGTITTNLLAMLEDEKHTDTTFVVEERHIKAHSFILVARSEIFDRELNGSMQESVSKVVEIKDIDFATFDVFLRFLYSDDLDHVELTIKKQVEAEKAQAAATSSGDAPCTGNPRTVILQNILAVSHKYQVQRLQLWCEQQLCEYICKDQACSILCQAHLYDAKQLEKACLGFIKNNMDAVMATRSFGSLSAEWPAVMLKINVFLAGLSDSKASEVIAAHEESRRKRGGQESVLEFAAPVEKWGEKRPRTE